MLSGVPQGTVLAPLLFTCYVNDIQSTVKSKIRLYVDDILLYRAIHTDEDRLALQEDLNSLIRWSDLWLMLFNPTKYVHLKISNRHHLLATKYYIGQQQIDQLPQATYLGLTVGKHLKWTNHVDKIVVKSKSTIGFLRRNLSSCNTSVKKDCYLTLWLDQFWNMPAQLGSHIHKLMSTNLKWYNIMLPTSLQTTILIKQVSLQC